MLTLSLIIVRAKRSTEDSDTLETLSNYDDDDDDDNDNDNAEKKTGFMMSKTTALLVHHTFLYLSLTSIIRIRLETSQCDVLWRTWAYDDKFSFLYLNMDKILKNSPPKKHLQVGYQ